MKLRAGRRPPSRRGLRAGSAAQHRRRPDGEQEGVAICFGGDSPKLVIDLGREGSDKGGAIVAIGTSKCIVKQKRDYTEAYFKPPLKSERASKEKGVNLAVLS